MNYNLNYIITDEFRSAIPFSKYIIEMFKNDYRMIKDFLTNNSSWDLMVEWNLSLTHDELIEKKVKMYNVINNTYSNCFLNCLSKNEFEKIISKDKALEYVMKNKVYTIQLFSENLEFATKMIKLYVEFLKRQTDIKECTYNKYKNDVENIIGIYNMEYMKNDMDEDLSYEENAINFFYKTNYKIKKYINNTFTFKNEKEEFINYIISLAYAYLKDMMNTSDEDILDEEVMFIRTIEKDKDLKKMFDNDDNFFTILFETLSSCLLEYRQSYDLRKKVTDDKSIEIFNKLDKNFNVEYSSDIVIEDYTIDILFERILKTFIVEFNNEQIFDLLTDEISIYNDLFSNGLDPRFEKRYKLLMMRKLIVNSYEYLFYLYSIKDERIDFNVVLEDIKLPKNNDAVFSFFCNNYNDILNMYREYNNKDINFNDRVRMEIYNNNLEHIIKMKRTYFFIEGRYFGIMSGRIKKFDSVDYINDINRKIFLEKRLELNGIKEVKKYFKTICYYVYERIINMNDCSKGIEIEINDMITAISSIDNFTEEILKNKELFGKINFWYVNLSSKEISYYEESKLRNKINNPEHIKVLNRLNEFNENINNQKK